MKGFHLLCSPSLGLPQPLWFIQYLPPQGRQAASKSHLPAGDRPTLRCICGLDSPGGQHGPDSKSPYTRPLVSTIWVRLNEWLRRGSDGRGVSTALRDSASVGNFTEGEKGRRLRTLCRQPSLLSLPQPGRDGDSLCRGTVNTPPHTSHLLRYSL